MSYRDDRDALHARNDALEAEVQALREERDRALEAAGQEPHSSRFVVPGSRSAVHPGAVGGLVGASVAAFAVVMSVRAFMGHSGASAPVSAVGTALAVWDATVVSAQGKELAVGAPCTIESRLQLDRTHVTSARTKVRCGSVVLYDGEDRRTPPGASQATFEATHRSVTEEEVGNPDYANLEQVFDLVFEERGAPARALPRITVDTTAGTANLRRELSSLSVDLAVTPGSRPVSVRWMRP